MGNPARRFVWLAIAVALLITTSFLSLFAATPTPPQDDPIARAKKAYTAVKSYDAECWTVERVNGKLKAEERVRAVLVKQPWKMYFRWLPGGPHEGMQCSYVPSRDGANNYMGLEAGARGLIGAQRYAFDNALINRLYPHQQAIKNYHMGFLLERVETRTRQALKLGKLTITDDGIKTNLIPGRQLHVYTGVLAKDYPPDPIDGARYWRTIVGYEVASGLPLYIETYTVDGQLFSRYKYMKFTANPAIDPNLFELK